jgi:D-alanyl-lipoteichoic acid acyltransferase DltB (MBOAT superfamily)
MLFTDPVFLFAFLPISLLLYYATRRFLGGAGALWFLFAASAFFYGYWSLKYLALLLSQIMVNYLFARRLAQTPSRALLWAAIGANLLLLGYFKYRNFFLENLGILTGWQFHLAALFVPLGISFHTFQQITFVTDVADGEAEVPPLSQYVLFVMFFPQLIAGPIVLHREMGRQLKETASGHWLERAAFGPGFAIFCFGLFKKVCLADNLANFVDVAFQWPLHLQFLEAWCAAIGYALQLFFDFSGYSDMAVGLGLMFGFVLPFNFNVPFAATSMIEYWKRWHITMTRFFMMYCYAPLALSFQRTAANHGLGSVATFVLGIAIPTLLAFLASGLWHGAGWTFIMFGVVNGIGLTINHAWKQARMPRIPPALGWLLTAITILVTLVYFRSTSLAQAHSLLRTMFFPPQLALPLWADGLAAHLGLPVTFFEVFQAENFTAHYLCVMLLLAPLSVLLPNPSMRPFEVRPNIRTAFALGLMLWPTLGWLGEPRTFLYFQF